MMNLIMAIALYPIVLIMSLVFYNIGKRSDKMIYGVHLKDEQKNDERVILATKKYKTESIWIILIIALIPISFFFTKHVSIQFTLWIIWFLVAIVAMVLPYVHANKAMMALKNEGKANAIAENIANASEDVKGDDPVASIQYVETNIVRTVRLSDFLPQMILSTLAPISIPIIGKLIFKESNTYSMLEVYLWTTVTFALLTFLFFWIAKIMDRLQAVVISNDSAINTSFNRAKKNIWRQIWIRESWLNTITVIVIAAAGLIQKNEFVIFMASIIAESIIGIIILIFALKDIRKVNASYESKKDEAYSSDDDEYWIWGMFYNNPHDKRGMVEKRYGSGTTTNIASKTGKITFWIGFAALIWIPFMCIWLIMEDFTPMNVYVENEYVVCHHLTDSYKISSDNIAEVELMSKLPEHRSKINGIGTDEIEKGKYSCKDYGTYFTFVRCNNSQFIRIKTNNNQTYIISGMSDSETTTLFNQINK